MSSLRQREVARANGARPRRRSFLPQGLKDILDTSTSNASVTWTAGVRHRRHRQIALPSRYETRMYRIRQRSRSLLLLQANPPRSQESAEKLPVETAPAENLENAKTNRNQNPELPA